MFYGKRTVFATALQVRLSVRQTATGRGFVVIHVQSQVRFFSKSRCGFLVFNDTRVACLLRLFVHGCR